MTHQSDEQLTGGRLNSAICNAVMRVHSRAVGRGPAKAQAFFRHNIVVLLMQDSMTMAERSLVAHDKSEGAVDMRRHSQSTMQADLVAQIELLTGCQVTAFMTDNLVSPDLIAEVYVLDRPVPGEQPALPLH